MRIYNECLITFFNKAGLIDSRSINDVINQSQPFVLQRNGCDWYNNDINRSRIDQTCFIRRHYKKQNQEKIALRSLYNARQQAIETENIHK